MINEKPKLSETQEILYCECGGRYKHIDTRNNGNGTYDDTYRCGSCGTWCIVTWNKEDDEETGRRYEER